MNKTIKLLMLADYNSFTGFATVSKNLISEWFKYFSISSRPNIAIDIVAINYFGDDYVDGNLRVISAKNKDKVHDDFGRHVFLGTLANNDYDVIFILQDLGIIIPMIKHLKEIKTKKQADNRPNFRSIFYFPVDYGLFWKHSVGLDFFDVLVTYTDWGRKEVLRLCPELKGKVRVLPHGTNTTDFYPLNRLETSQFRRQYFGANAHKFIICNINRNQPRKDIPTTIFTFIEYQKEYNKDAFLYLHMNPNDPLGYNLKDVFAQTPLVEGKDYMFPPQEDYEKGAPVKKLNQVYNACDVFITTATGEGWGLCLHPDSQVLTLNGSVDIASIKVGEKVLGNDGKYHTVLDKTSRKVDSLMHVKTMYGYSVKATHEHPYFVMSQDGTQSWKKVGELSKSDFLGIVKPEKTSVLPQQIDLLNYLPADGEWKYDNEYIFNPLGRSGVKHEWSISEIVKRYNSSKSVVEDAILYVVGGKTPKKGTLAYDLAQKLILDGFEKKDTVVKIKRWVTVTNDFLWLIGAYLGDGSSTGSRIEFSLNNYSKKHVADRVESIVKELFGATAAIKSEGKRFAVRISSKLLANFFAIECGKGAFNKHVPAFLMPYASQLMPLVKGYFDCDGHYRPNRNMISFTTISNSLVYQVASILASNDIMLHISYRKRTSSYNCYHGRIPNAHCRKYLSFVGVDDVLKRDSRRQARPFFKETETHFFVPIKEISEIKHNDTVYDICVEDSHSFVANGIVCHNTVTEAMTAMLPCILPNHTSLAELGANGRAWMLNELYPVCNQVDNIIRFQTDLYEGSDTLNSVWHALQQGETPDRVVKAYFWATGLTWHDTATKFAEEILKLA